MILFVIVMTRIQEKSAAVVAPNVIALTDLVQRQVHSLSYLSSEEIATHNIKLPCLPLEKFTGLWSAAFH